MLCTIYFWTGPPELTHSGTKLYSADGSYSPILIHSYLRKKLLGKCSQIIYKSCGFMEAMGIKKCTNTKLIEQKMADKQPGAFGGILCHGTNPITNSDSMHYWSFIYKNNMWFDTNSQNTLACQPHNPKNPNKHPIYPVTLNEILQKIKTDKVSDCYIYWSFPTPKV